MSEGMLERPRVSYGSTQNNVERKNQPAAFGGKPVQMANESGQDTQSLNLQGQQFKMKPTNLPNRGLKEAGGTEDDLFAELELKHTQKALESEKAKTEKNQVVINSLEKAISSKQQFIFDFKDQIQTREKQAEDLNVENDSLFSNLQISRSNEESLNKKLEFQVNETKRLECLANELYEALEKASSQVDDLEQKTEELQSKTSLLEQEKAELEKSLKSEVKKLNDQIKSLNDQLLGLETSSSSEAKGLYQQTYELTREKETTVNNLNNKINNLTKDLESKTEELEKTAKTLQESQDKVESFAKELQVANDEISRLTLNNKGLENKIQSLSDEKERLNNALTMAQENLRRISSLLLIEGENMDINIIISAIQSLQKGC